MRRGERMMGRYVLAAIRILSKSGKSTIQQKACGRERRRRPAAGSAPCGRRGAPAEVTSSAPATASSRSPSLAAQRREPLGAERLDALPFPAQRRSRRAQIRPPAFAALTAARRPSSSFRSSPRRRPPRCRGAAGRRRKRGLDEVGRIRLHDRSTRDPESRTRSGDPACRCRSAPSPRARRVAGTVP